MENIKRYTEANRLAWNEVMPRHQGEHCIREMKIKTTI